MAHVFTSEDKLREFLEQMYGKKLTNAELTEYKERMVKFFSILVEIDMKNKRIK